MTQELWDIDENGDAIPHAHARTTDPETSHEAAASLSSEFLRASQRSVLELMRSMGVPMTDEAIALWYGNRSPAQSPSGLRTRRAELVERGLVRDSGQRIKLSSGRRGIQWEIVS